MDLKKKAKVLLFACDPGGANTIAPLVKQLKAKHYVVSLFGKNEALKIYHALRLTVKHMPKSVNSDGLKGIGRFLKRQNPAFIITGTSSNDKTEKWLWAEGEKLGIPSFAILDHWTNYGLRFSRYGTDEIAKYQKRQSIDYLPTKIFVMDNYAKAGCVADGLPAGRLVVSGQPYFELMRENLKKITPAALRGFKRQHQILSGEFLVTFASQPIIKSYGRAKAMRQFGYTEKTIAKILLDELRPLAGIRPITLIIKLHPREDLGDWEALVGRYRGNGLKVKILPGGNVWKLMKVSDLVCGMTSIFLVEAMILGRPVLSIQIRRKKRGDFILEQRRVLNPALNRAILKRQLAGYILKHQRAGGNFKIIAHPSANIINYLGKFYGPPRDKRRQKVSQ